MTIDDPRATGASRVPIEHFSALRRDAIGFMRGLSAGGDVSSVVLGEQPLYLLNHPDLIRDVLVLKHKSFSKAIGIGSVKQLLGEGLLTAEGEVHRRHRRLAQPAFHRQRLASYADTMVAFAERALDWWRDGAPVDIGHDMMRLTLGIAGKTLFDADLEGDTKEVGEAMAEISELSNLVAFPLVGMLGKFELLGRRRFDRAQARLDATIYRIIEERRAHGGDRGDLLSMLMVATDEEDGQGISDRQLRDEVMTLFLAGHDTTANALTWTWHLLSQHPEAEARLHEEVDAALGGRRPSIEDMPRLAFVDQVLAESMRLYPPVWIMARKAVEDCAVGGHVIPEGAIVLMSQYLMHRDPRFFDDPEVFFPGRWTAEMKAELPRFAYFPFGGGPRQCLGEHFSWMESVLLIATIARQWRFRRMPGFEVELHPSIVLRPKHGLHMVPEGRDSSLRPVESAE
jgi:cytochrome P450